MPDKDKLEHVITLLKPPVAPTSPRVTLKLLIRSFQFLHSLVPISCSNLLFYLLPNPLALVMLNNHSPGHSALFTHLRLHALSLPLTGMTFFFSLINSYSSDKTLFKIHLCECPYLLQMHAEMFRSECHDTPHLLSSDSAICLYTCMYLYISSYLYPPTCMLKQITIIWQMLTMVESRWWLLSSFNSSVLKMFQVRGVVGGNHLICEFPHCPRQSDYPPQQHST